VEHEAVPFGRIGNLAGGFLVKLGSDGEIALLEEPEKRVLLPFGRPIVPGFDAVALDPRKVG
jgi:hypothetical protein